jgi:phosphoglycolate phosphatase
VAACIATYRSLYAEVSLRDTPTYPGMAEALAAVGRVPGRRLAVATSKPRAFAEPLLRALGMVDAFEVVAAPELDLHVESKTATVGAALRALRWDGAIPAAMVGDRHVDMEAARAHGLRAVGVLWGFGTASELRAAGADVLVSEPSQLPTAV